MVIASCVLHATTDLNTTLSNTRKLLKAGGKLVLLEPCNLSCARLSFVFGLLPGWWLGTESYRRWGPLLPDDMWHDILSGNGFSGADMCLRDYDGCRHTISVMTWTAENIRPICTSPPKVSIIITPKSILQHQLAREVQDRLHTAIHLSSCEIVILPEIMSQTFEEAFCVFLPELEAPFLSCITAENFDSLQRLVQSCRAVIWVMQDGGQPAQGPETGLATSFGRCMSSENSRLDLVTLALENISSSAKIGEYIVKIIQSAIVNPQEARELEYVEQDGILCINRVVEDNKMNNIIFSAVVPQKPKPRKYGEKPERALALTISSPGLLDTLHFADDLAEKALGPDEVEINVKAVGVNFKNVMVALGQLPDKSLGQECAGTVTRIGDGVCSEIGVGDRVCCVTHGAFKTYARSHLSSVHRIPDDMTFTTAAAMPVAFCTAYYSLHHLAGLKEGQSILIHAAAGGVGQAAIQLAQLTKAVIFVTVGTDQKKQLIMDLYKIPEEHIFSSRNLSFAQGINRLTKGRGVDVVLNSLAGQSLRQSFDCLAPLGRFVEIGKLDMYMREHLQMAPFLKGVTFASVDLAVIAEQAQQLMTEMMEAVMSLAHTSIHSPQPLNVFRVSELESAFRFLQSGKNAGKTVIEIHEEDLVPVSGPVFQSRLDT